MAGDLGEMASTLLTRFWLQRSYQIEKNKHKILPQPRKITMEKEVRQLSQFTVLFTFSADSLENVVRVNAKRMR